MTTSKNDSDKLDKSIENTKCDNKKKGSVIKTLVLTLIVLVTAVTIHFISNPYMYGVDFLGVGDWSMNFSGITRL